MVETQVLHQLHTPHLGHDHIGEDQIIGMRLDRRQGLLAVGGGVHQIAGREQNILYQLQDSRLIVHYENDRLLFHHQCRLLNCGANGHPSQQSCSGILRKNLTLFFWKIGMALRPCNP